MEYVICIVLPLFLILGIWLAKGTQDFIDEQNNRLRQDQKWRDKNNGWNEWTTLWNNRQKQRY